MAFQTAKPYIGGRNMSEMFQERVVKIKVIGVGGAGNNVISNEQNSMRQRMRNANSQESKK